MFDTAPCAAKFKFNNGGSILIVTVSGVGLQYEYTNGLITNITGGTITSTDEVFDGSFACSATGLSFSAADFFVAVVTNDPDVQLVFLLGADDTIYGTDGRWGDVLTGNVGADTFVFGAKVTLRNADTLRDFDHAADQIEPLRAGLGRWVVWPRMRSTPGPLRRMFDKVGVSGADAVLFATVKVGTVVDHTDFLIG